MPHPFDVTTKDLVERFPADWAALAGAPLGVRAECLETDVATVSGQADKVVIIHDEAPWLLNLEFQSSADATLAHRMHRDAAILHERHRLPVESLVILLRPQADHSSLTGRLDFGRPGGVECRFGYRVERLWSRSAASVVRGGVGLMPLAFLCADAREHLLDLKREMERRLASESVPPDRVATLWIATYTLMGLIYPREVADRLLAGVRGMRESVTYQAILAEGREEGREEGRLEEARKMLLLVAAGRLGEPSRQVRAAVGRIGSLERLHALAGRIQAVESWDDLLAE